MISGLDSASLKVIRAAKHLDAIKRVIAGITSKAGSHEIIKNTDGKETVKFLVDPPPDITILAGEIVYQLRSALDHLAFDLVKLNSGGITLPAGWERRCDFPLWVAIPDKQIKRGHTSPPLPYNCFTKSLPGISKTAFTFIESVQPYHTEERVHEAMRLIAQLSNVDRHRHLNVTLPRVAVRQTIKLTGDREFSMTRGGFKDGAEIETPSAAKADDIVDVQRSFAEYVTFDEPTVGAGPDTLEVQHILEFCLEQVQRVIIPAFIRLLKKP